MDRALVSLWNNNYFNSGAQPVSPAAAVTSAPLNNTESNYVPPTFSTLSKGLYQSRVRFLVFSRLSEACPAAFEDHVWWQVQLTHYGERCCKGKTSVQHVFHVEMNDPVRWENSQQIERKESLSSDCGGGCGAQSQRLIHSLLYYALVRSSQKVFAQDSPSCPSFKVADPE